MSLVTKRIVWTNDHGQLVVTRPHWNARLISELRNPTDPTRVIHYRPPMPAYYLVHQLDGDTYRAFGALVTWAETEREFLNRVQPGIVVDAVDDLPDWRWRNAWKLEDGKVVIDVDAARGLREQELLREKRKRERDTLPAATDAALVNARSIADLEAVVLE